MAGLKKKKKEKSGSPNIVLVVFMVLFILVTIGLGILAYSQKADVEESRKKVAAANALATSEKLGKRFQSLLAREMRLAIGEQLDAKELEQLTVDRDDFLRDANGGAFKDEADKEMAQKLLEKLKKRLGAAENGKDFKSNFEKEFAESETKNKELQGKLFNAIAKNERMESLSAKLIKQQDQFNRDTDDKINKNAAKALAASNVKTDEFKQAAENYLKLTQELKDKQDEMEKVKEDHNKLLKQRERKIASLAAELKELAAAGGGGGGMRGGARPAGEPFPLLLDISPGMPLWDAPVGKVIRVDLDLRQVSINLGSAHGVVPELTFNIFGANATGRAEKQLKGTIEVIKVLDTTTSIARITSLYDAEGREIMMNLQTRNRNLRESESPIREGDLLFNLFWGTRVAVAGYVSITGEASDNPTEQYRQMDDFMHLLRRNGMQVDAYVDLRDGQIKGRISPNTRYLIRGEDFRIKRKPGEDAKDKDAGKDAEPGMDRLEAVNLASRALRKEAIDRGLLLISSTNFATVIGYRKTRNGNSQAVSNFRSTLPYAGSGGGGVITIPDRKEAEKKDAK